MKSLRPMPLVTGWGFLRLPGEKKRRERALTQARELFRSVNDDDRRRAVLFNDITHAEVQHHIRLSDRQRITDFLWAQGWRRDVRPEDATH